jgi:hypothetical protein
MGLSGISSESGGADRAPRTMNLSLRPQDSSLLDGMKLDQVVDIAIHGKITSVSQSDYGCNVTLEIDSAGLAIKTPEPAKFVEQVDKLKVLKS